MSPPEEARTVGVDFVRAVKLLPLLEKDISALDRATEMYVKNFLRFKVKFLSLFHTSSETERPATSHPMNQAAAGLELSHLVQLYELIADEESLTNVLRRVEQNNERLSAVCGLLKAYSEHFHGIKNRAG